jgi:hypothetical protein
MNGYSIPKPRWPLSLWLLMVTLGVGLAALFLAAFHAFDEVMPTVQAVFAAALIEVGVVVEAISLVRGRNRLALVALSVSLVVSGTYNYIQVEIAGKNAGITDTWQLFTLALGPLSALTFLAMAAGKEMSEHDARVAAWQTDRQAWMDKERQRKERREDRQRKRQMTTNVVKATKPATNDGKPAQFARGYDGFVEYMSWCRAKGIRTPTKEQIASDMGRSTRTIERYLAVEPSRFSAAAGDD